jgi:hypothetical protein
MRVLKYMSLVLSIGIAFLISGISGCFPDPYSVGEPDSLFSEYVLVWDLVDSHYACFFAKENMNWDQAFQIFKPAAENLDNRSQLSKICLELLGELKDQNLIIRDSDGTRLDSWNQGAFINWDLGVWINYMNELVPSGYINAPDTYGAIAFNPTPADSVGYVYISDLGNAFSMISFYYATNEIEHCSGIILDLRMCSYSGFEDNARNASGRFIEESTLAYYRAFREGPGRNDMEEMQQVMAYRNGMWQFTKPIILLTGRSTQGAGEQMVLFLKTQQHVTVIGDTTAGFANPAASFNLTEGWTIEIPEMVTYSPDTILILNSGIAPDILIPVSEADFTAGVDPVFDAALEMILQ